MEVAFDDFQKYLISKQIVNEKKIPHYVNWVKKCLSNSKKGFGSVTLPQNSTIEK